jgi:hypothetical protein
VLARLGHAAEPAIQQAYHLDIVEHLAKPCQRKQLVLVAGARPAAIAPQQVAADGRDGQARVQVAQDRSVPPISTYRR